jgi:hypothetical protein
MQAIDPVFRSNFPKSIAVGCNVLIINSHIDGGGGNRTGLSMRPALLLPMVRWWYTTTHLRGSRTCVHVY